MKQKNGSSTSTLKKRVARTAGSKKAKGAKLEKEVARLYRHYGLFPDARRQLLSGGSYLKGDIYKGVSDWASDECKNAETIRIPEWWAQTQAQCSSNQEPVLHISGNYRPIVTVWPAKTARHYIEASGLYFEEFTSTKENIALWKDYEPLRQHQHAVLYWHDKAITSVTDYMVLRTYE